ncbi:hotdog domain-containing protein [Thermoflavimicrobium daqui]|uniref:3-aminobutyryl-CoA ammonia lyase n=1 Tax=Thermoflavimicrobium daqui TaxID=2137476 RepID=UPI00197E5DC2|nr:hotdog domain-containing protein [Thermoflavimicrobium daqui]
MIETMIRIRMSQQDAHYGGNLVDGARILGLFGDIATEILIRHDGDEGLFVAYDEVTFKAPVYAGDFIEAVGRLKRVGNTSRKIVFEAYKVIEAVHDPDRPYLGRVLKEPILVASASGTCVVPKNR